MYISTKSCSLCPRKQTNRCEYLAPCVNAPHCDDAEWLLQDQKLSKPSRGLQRKLEYLLLYAAEDHCAKCCAFYIHNKDVAKDCLSSEMTALQWAQRGAEKRNCDVPPELLQLLQN